MVFFPLEKRLTNKSVLFKIFSSTHSVKNILRFSNRYLKSNTFSHEKLKIQHLTRYQRVLLIYGKNLYFFFEMYLLF